MRIFPIAVIGIMLAACTTSTGVIPAGPNTYALTVRVSPIAGGSMAAQPKALASAQAYCQTQGREMMLTSSEVVNERQAATPPEYGITFRCLLPTDPEFHR
jgi:hypothetical protein